MAICSKCGSNYLTRECLKCKNNIGYKKKNLWKISFFILILILIMAALIVIPKINDLNSTVKYYENKVETLTNEKENLEKQNNLYKQNIDNLLRRNQRVQKRNDRKIYIQPKTKKKVNHYIKPKKEIVYANQHKTEPKIKKQKPVKQKSFKRYPNYTGYEKLVSDSRITKDSNNKLSSNSPIYGIYKYPLSGGITCGNNPRIYKIRNECSAYAPMTLDRLYFSKSNIDELKSFDTSTHKIECNYSKKEGIMHDCRTKIFKYKYR